jgi:hypothetical protein
MAGCAGGPDKCSMVAIVFTCPITEMKVQHWVDDDDEAMPDDAYEMIVCKACARLHFINSKSGRLLGQQEE